MVRSFGSPLFMGGRNSLYQGSRHPFTMMDAPLVNQELKSHKWRIRRDFNDL